MAHRDQNAEYANRIRSNAAKVEENIDNINRRLQYGQTIAAETLEDLNDQNEQLQNIERTTDLTEDNLAYAKKQSRYLNKGWLGWMFSKEVKKPPVKSSAVPVPEGRTSGSSRPSGLTSSDAQQPSSSSSLNTAALRQTGQTQLATELDVHDRAYNQGMDQMSANIDRLLQMGLAIGEELDKSTAKIEAVDTKVERNADHMTDVNTALKKITKK